MKGLKFLSSGTGNYTDGNNVRSGNITINCKVRSQPIGVAVKGHFTFIFLVGPSLEGPGAIGAMA